MEIKWDAAAAEKDGYEHFMMKEIHEQPRAVRDTLSPRIKENEDGEKIIDLSETGLTDEDFTNVSRVYLIGCGSAYHVGMAARYVIEKLARVPCEVDLASEFRYRDPILEENGLVVIISQSGETADSLAARRAHAGGGQRRRLVDRARGGQRDVYLGRSGNRRRDDQGVFHPAGGAVSGRCPYGRGARADHEGTPRRADCRDARPAGSN